MRIWWCQEHEQSALGGASPSYCTSKHYWPDGYPGDCRMVPMRLIPDRAETVAGSGSTGIAAAQMGRRFLGFEISPQFTDLANARLAQGVLAL